jgi:hypothetical protein
MTEATEELEELAMAAEEMAAAEREIERLQSAFQMNAFALRVLEAGAATAESDGPAAAAAVAWVKTPRAEMFIGATLAGATRGTHTDQEKIRELLIEQRTAHETARLHLEQAKARLTHTSSSLRDHSHPPS